MIPKTKRQAEKWVLEHLGSIKHVPQMLLDMQVEILMSVESELIRESKGKRDAADYLFKYHLDNFVGF